MPTLQSFLTKALPGSHSNTYKAYHLTHRPYKHPDLVPPPVSVRESSNFPERSRTTLQSHLLLLSSLEISEVFVFGIEILVYVTPDHTILYVSKADSTGFTPSKTGGGVTGPFITSFIRYLVSTTRRSGIPTRIQLFARSQGQYLFPGSADNSQKQILNDAALIRWWLRVLNPLLQATDENNSSNGRLYIPGVDSHTIKSYFPPANTVPTNWYHAPPGITPCMPATSALLAREIIPTFPDDPKARFLADLERDGALKATTVNEFWELMAYRQECSLGRLVGFINVDLLSKEERNDTNGNRKADYNIDNGAVVVDETMYDKAYEDLTSGDYETKELAKASTVEWISSILGSLKEAEKKYWGLDIIPSGEEKGVDSPITTSISPTIKGQINILGAGFVRKKRLIEVEANQRI